MALLEASNEIGIWEYKNRSEKAKFHHVTEELMECYGLVNSIDMIWHTYRALLAQAVEVSMQDSRKTGEVKPDDVVLSLVFKLYEKTNESRVSYEVTFLFS